MRIVLPRDAIIHHSANEVGSGGKAARQRQAILTGMGEDGAAGLLGGCNMIVMNPGGYRFGDYWRLGVPIMVGWLVVAVGLIPVVWPL